MRDTAISTISRPPDFGHSLVDWNWFRKWFERILGVFPLLVIALMALLLAGVAVYAWTLGVPKFAAAFGGLALLLFSIVPLRLDKFVAWRFALVQLFFGVGMFLVVPALQKYTPFTTVECFEIGSFSLLVTATLLRSGEESYRNLLAFSTLATTLLFFAGFTKSFEDVTLTQSATATPNPTSDLIITSFFALGAFNLLLVSALFLLIFTRAEFRKSRKWAETSLGD